jgi:hypothetical protein
MLVHGMQWMEMVEMREMVATESRERDASAASIVALVNGCPVRFDSSCRPTNAVPLLAAQRNFTHLLVHSSMCR